MKKIISKEEKGFTLLYAILVSILVLSVGASIISITLKQTILSNSSRDSQLAFYASNTGIECALYWDIIGVELPTGETRELAVFPFSDATINQVFVEDYKDQIKCANGNIVTGVGFTNLQTYTGAWSQSNNVTTFRMALQDELSPSNEKSIYCAEVTITKTRNGDNINTRIVSQGLSNCDTEHPRTVQRGLVMEY